MKIFNFTIYLISIKNTIHHHKKEPSNAGRVLFKHTVMYMRTLSLNGLHFLKRGMWEDKMHCAHPS